MKNYKNKKINTKKIIFISLISLLSIILILGILEFFNVINFISKVVKVSQTSEQTQQNIDNIKIKKDFIENQSNNPDSPKIIKPTSEDIVISSTKSGDNIIISTQLKNYSDGECDLLIENGTNSYSRSVPVIYQPSFSTCAGFSVAKSELGSGTWSILLSVTSNNQTNQTTNTIEVN